MVMVCPAVIYGSNRPLSHRPFSYFQSKITTIVLYSVRLHFFSSSKICFIFDAIFFARSILLYFLKPLPYDLVDKLKTITPTCNRHRLRLSESYRNKICIMCAVWSARHFASAKNINKQLWSTIPFEYLKYIRLAQKY